MRSARNFCKAVQTVLFKRTQSKPVYNLTFKLFKIIFTGLSWVFRVEESLKEIFWYYYLYTALFSIPPPPKKKNRKDYGRRLTCLQALQALISPVILNLPTRSRRMFGFTFRPLLPFGKSPRYPFYRRLGELQSRSRASSNLTDQPVTCEARKVTSQTPPVGEAEASLLHTYMSSRDQKSCSWIPMELETKHYCAGEGQQQFNSLNPSSQYTYHMVEPNKTLHSAHKVYLCVPYGGSHNKQRLFP
jgi:hypothetical protein